MILTGANSYKLRRELAPYFDCRLIDTPQDIFTLGQSMPDVIVSETLFPGELSYLQLVRKLKADTKTAHIPFLVLGQSSSYATSRQLAEFVGADAYFLPQVSAEVMARYAYRLLKQEEGKVNKPKQMPESYRTPLAKRLFDVVFAGLVLLLLSPVLLLVALLIKLDSRGPVFYTSKRAGAGYKVFDFYKFRSMRTGADKELQKLSHLNQYKAQEQDKQQEITDCIDCRKQGEFCSPRIFYKGQLICEQQYGKLKKASAEASFVKLKDDPRITRLGHFLRNTSIDELPQLFNVFKGDMSIVGNRPLPLYEAQQLTTDQWIQRFTAPAGITGLWQVSKRGKSEMSEQERLDLDNEYARKYSIWYDIKLILRTIPALLQSENV